MKPLLLLLVVLCGFCQTVQPWQYTGENRSALAVRGYIDRARIAEDVSRVVVEVDSSRYEGIAIVTVTVFTNDTTNVPVTVMLDFHSLADSSVQISDTTYLKETRN